MKSLDKLAAKVGNGSGGSISPVVVMRRPCGEIVVAERGFEIGEGDQWSGSLGAWQLALRSALEVQPHNPQGFDPYA